MLAAGALDFGFLSPPFEKPPRMTVVPISDEPAVAGLPSSCANPNAKNVSPKLLSDRLIIFRKEDGPYLYDMTLAMFRGD
jgi:DNA-binding transcriptional LysR family regulator